MIPYKGAKLTMRVTAWKGDNVILDTTRTNKQRFQHIIRELKGADKYYLRVTYGRGKTSTGMGIIYNEGDYTNKKDLLEALSIFTSKAEVEDYLENFKK